MLLSYKFEGCFNFKDHPSNHMELFVASCCYLKYDGFSAYPIILHLPTKSFSAKNLAVSPLVECTFTLGLALLKNPLMKVINL